MTAIEKLGYRVTVGDVAAQAGLEVNLAQRGLLALASDVGGNLQVGEAGEIAYVFPENLRAILRTKFLRLRLQEIWSKVWAVLFYLIRISFGIALILSIVLIFLAIAVILIALSSRSGNSSDGNSDGDGFSMPNIWFFPDFFWFFDPYPYRSSRRRDRRSEDESSINFLEGIFSFLFGDGNPNANLEDRRWQQVGAVIANHQGAVTAEQLAPFLDQVPQQGSDESYVIPALSRFDGRPEVSPEGDIIYQFPELQTTAQGRKLRSAAKYLKETLWQFSRAKPWQIIVAIGLGSLNLIGAMVLWYLLGDGSLAAELGGLVAFVQSIFWILLGYGIGFLGIPLGRYYWLLSANSKIKLRNQQRQDRAAIVENPNRDLQRKFSYARQFAVRNYVSEEKLAYTTEKDLVDQELEQRDAIDAEWQRRLNESTQD